MAKKTKDNPTGSPLGKFSVLNLVVKGVDSLTGYDRSKEYFDKKKPYQKPRRVFKKVLNPNYKPNTSTPKFIDENIE